MDTQHARSFIYVYVRMLFHIRTCTQNSYFHKKKIVCIVRKKIVRKKNCNSYLHKKKLCPLHLAPPLHLASRILGDEMERAERGRRGGREGAERGQRGGREGAER